MSLLNCLKGDHQILSIVGLAKNAGKTTALNYLIEEAMDCGMTLGITSTGRDGETLDMVTGTEKPRVYVDYGTIVTVPARLYDAAEAGLEIMRATEYSSPLGNILLCRTVDSGYVQIGGPLNTCDHRRLCMEMLARGAELVLIDGAIDRRSIAAPGISDGTILSTGAVLSRNMKKAVEETYYAVSLYRLPELADRRFREAILNSGISGKILIIDKDYGVTSSELKTGLNAGRYLDALIGEDTACVYLPGALTAGVLEDIHPKKLAAVPFVVGDPTRIFIELHTWKTLEKKGLRVLTLNSIEVAAVTVNPQAPGGHRFVREEFVNALREVITEIPVVDVKAGGM